MNFPQNALVVTLIFLLQACPAWAASSRVQLGIDTLAANKFRGLEGKRIGLITNQTGVDSNGRGTIDILKNAPGINLVALFAPEHGLYGDNLAGAYVATSTDSRTGLPVYSLFQATQKPTPEMLKNIDVLVYDIQDIGCRSYTFISTMGLAMEAAGESNIEFYVLDRPDPLGGNRIEGMPLDPKFKSFVGEWEIPYVYGLTPGELARMIYEQKWIAAQPKLTIVPMKGWYRSMTWEDTGLIWVPTSPNIPTPDAAMDYVVTGIVGIAAPGINHGVGYTLPFGLLGAKDWNAFQIAEDLQNLQQPGFFFRPAFYKPFSGELKEEILQGTQIYITDPDKADLCKMSAILLEKVQMWTGGKLFAQMTPDQIAQFDQLCGGDHLRTHFQAGKSAAELVISWEPSLSQFKALRRPYLIYKEKPPETPVVAPAPAPTPPTPAKADTAKKPTKKTRKKSSASSSSSND